MGTLFLILAVALLVVGVYMLVRGPVAAGAACLVAGVLLLVLPHLDGRM